MAKHLTFIAFISFCGFVTLCVSAIPAILYRFQKQINFVHSIISTLLYYISDFLLSLLLLYRVTIRFIFFNYTKMARANTEIGRADKTTSHNIIISWENSKHRGNRKRCIKTKRTQRCTPPNVVWMCDNIIMTYTRDIR